LITEEDVQKLGCIPALDTLNKMNNLGLGEHDDFDGDVIDTGKGNAETHELHERIIRCLKIRRTSSTDSGTPSSASSATTTQSSVDSTRGGTVDAGASEAATLLGASTDDEMALDAQIAELLKQQKEALVELLKQKEALVERKSKKRRLD